MIKKYKNEFSEIDILRIAKLIWDGKLKIILITIIFTLVSFFYATKQTPLYSFSLVVEKSKPIVFANYKNLNFIKFSDFTNGINAERVFESFFYNPMNLSEISKMLEDKFIVKKNLANSDSATRQKEISNLASSFKLRYVSAEEHVELDEPILRVSFKWKDADEGVQLLNLFLQANLEYTRQKLINEIKDLYTTVEIAESNSLKKLELEAQNILDLSNIKIVSRKLLLEEYLSMAKELGIEYPVYNNEGGFYPTKYFLGYKAIKKEIDILNSRSNEEIILMSPSYEEIQKQIKQLKTSLELSTMKLDETIKILEKDDLKDWLHYNMTNANVNLLTLTTKKIVNLGLILGIIIGVLYVLGNNLLIRFKNL